MYYGTARDKHPSLGSGGALASRRSGGSGRPRFTAITQKRTREGRAAAQSVWCSLGHVEDDYPPPSHPRLPMLPEVPTRCVGLHIAAPSSLLS